MKLEVVTSSFHLKVTFYIEKESRSLLEGENTGNTNPFDLDTRKDEIRPTPDEEFEFLQLGENFA